jgi:hypothetical protein
MINEKRILEFAGWAYVRLPNNMKRLVVVHPLGARECNDWYVDPCGNKHAVTPDITSLDWLFKYPIPNIKPAPVIRFKRLHLPEPWIEVKLIGYGVAEAVQGDWDKAGEALALAICKMLEAQDGN